MDKTINIAENVGYALVALMLAYFVWVMVGVARGHRALDRKPFLRRLLKGLLLLSPVLLGALLLPFTNSNVPFLQALGSLGDHPESLLIFGLVLTVYLLYFVTTFFPHRNKYFNLGAPMAMLSPIPSITNASIIFIINFFLSNSDLAVSYMTFYFILTVYLFTYTAREIKLLSLVISENITADLNRNIIRNIFLSDYQAFEKTKKGSLFIILGDDINQIAVFASNLVAFYTNILTVLIIMAYLVFVNMIAVFVLLAVVSLILSIHYFMGVKTAVYFKRSAKVRSVYMDKLLGVINGFKELSIHAVKRNRYRGEVEKLCSEYTAINHTAFRKYVDRVMVSDMSFIISIGLSCFLLPAFFQMERRELITYILAALFLWGPINVIIRAIPELISIRTSLKRIREFIGGDVAFNDHADVSQRLEKGRLSTVPYAGREMEKLEAHDLYFEYKTNHDAEEQYFIGPLDFQARRGEITFVIGGNGSGKTTLAKLLCGLYTPQQGIITIDDTEVAEKELGEYFSVIFSDFYLFRKVYTERSPGPDEHQRLIEMMKLEQKVSFENDEFNTIELSRGQSKRLALIQCLMEDRPVFLFDECAADQDPDFKSFFYKELLPEIRRRGKILIVITHDDSYFDVADRIYKMETGNIKLIKAREEEVASLA